MGGYRRRKTLFRRPVTAASSLRLWRGDKDAERRTPRRCAAADATELDIVVPRKEWGAPGRVPQRGRGGGGGGRGGGGSVKLGVQKKFRKTNQDQ